ncbi:MAG: MFS transporter [Candidatus Pacebacteria bacterium]|nr:MFS transporter [Candidatus Paceibacterota bacterium]
MDSVKIHRLYFLSFLFTLHIAISTYVNSTFLTSIIKENYVGLLYTISSILIIVLLAKSSRILKNIGNRKLTLYFLLFNMISLAGLILSKNPLVIMGSFVLFMATNTLVYFCLDIFIEHFSNPLKTGTIRGLYLTIINSAYVISPLIAALLISMGGYKFIYTIAIILVFFMAIGLAFSVKTFKDKKYKKEPMTKTYKYLKGDKNMFSIISVNFLLQFFYAWMVVYTPIYLYSHLNFNWDQIAVIFSIMLVPFVLLALPVGILVDKFKVNKKNLLFIGFLIIILSTASISILSSSRVIIWAIILFTTRIGASIIETTSEICFFEKISDKDTNILSLFRDLYPLAYIIAPLVATFIFIFIPFNQYFFLILGIIMTSGFYFISNIKNEETLSN